MLARVLRSLKHERPQPWQAIEGGDQALDEAALAELEILKVKFEARQAESSVQVTAACYCSPDAEASCC